MIAATPRVTLLSRPGCHLCDEARVVIAKVCAELATDWTEVDITTDQALLDSYRDEIPVTFVDGRQHDFWHVSEDRLRRALTG